MSNYHYGSSHYTSSAPAHTSHNSHGHHGRSRRAPRVSSQNAHRQYKAQNKSPKVVSEAPFQLNELRHKYEASKGFSLEDDEQFCPNLLTVDDLQQIYARDCSDRSSLSSGSPDASPLQQQVQPTPSLYLPTNSTFQQAYQTQSANMKIHQPLAQRTRNAIPIVDPSTRSVASPPLSVSPGRQMQQQHRTGVKGETSCEQNIKCKPRPHAIIIVNPKDVDRESSIIKTTPTTKNTISVKRETVKIRPYAIPIISPNDYNRDGLFKNKTVKTETKKNPFKTLNKKQSFKTENKNKRKAAKNRPNAIPIVKPTECDSSSKKQPVKVDHKIKCNKSEAHAVPVNISKSLSTAYTVSIKRNRPHAIAIINPADGCSIL